jgi:hypothetical protein
MNKLTIGQALKDGNWEQVQQKINKRFECNLPLSEVTKVFRREMKSDIGEGWSEGTWFMWIKNRMSFNYGQNRYRDEVKYNPLHFFFITIPEDMKMLGRLERDTTARSRIGQTELKTLCPINRVAMLVSSKSNRNA